jgi:protein-disulfide isomerase
MQVKRARPAQARSRAKGRHRQAATIEKLAEEIGVTGTPTIYLNDGQKTQELKDLLTLIKTKK